MPLARIDVAADTSPEVVKAISDVVYDTMAKIANVPEHDRFQIVNRHAADELVYPAAGYLGQSYTSKIVFIQITWNSGRTLEVKKAFYKAVAEGINEKTGILKGDIWINLVEVNREDWSFGGGEMQYAPPAA